MGVFKEIPNADGSGVTQFFRINQSKSTVETKEQGDFYIFKGQVSSRENLPTSENKIGDTYYIEKENKTVFWTGSKWSEVDAYLLNFDYEDSTNKPSINGVSLIGNKTTEELKIIIPSKVSELKNDSKYVSEEELTNMNLASKSYVIEQVNNSEHFKRQIVEKLPTVGKDNILYLVHKTGAQGDFYNEYLWMDNDYELIGSTATDLTDYYTKEESDALLNNKVNKDGNKGLSTNDYTNIEKTKLASLENYDDTQIKAQLATLHNYDDTDIKNDITALKTAENKLKTDVTTLQNTIKYKTGYIRLVKAGDSWSWMDVIGNTLTYAQAREKLGQEEESLVVEGLENDGKTSVIRYNIDNDTIHVWCINHEKEYLYLQVKGNNVIISNEGVGLHYIGEKTTLPTTASKGDVVKLVKNETKAIYYYDGSTWVAFDNESTIDLDNYLAKDNSAPYAPSADYNPATKLYVDNSISNIDIPEFIINGEVVKTPNFYAPTSAGTSGYILKSNGTGKAPTWVANGGGGTNNYENLTNKPKINGNMLLGNKTSTELGLQDLLVSGTNIKTINGASILTSGDIIVPTKTSQLTNDSNYATKQYVDGKPTILGGTVEPSANTGKNGDIYLLYTA